MSDCEAALEFGEAPEPSLNCDATHPTPDPFKSHLRSIGPRAIEPSRFRHSPTWPAYEALLDTARCTGSRHLFRCPGLSSALRCPRSPVFPCRLSAPVEGTTTLTQPLTPEAQYHGRQVALTAKRELPSAVDKCWRPPDAWVDRNR